MASSALAKARLYGILDTGYCDPGDMPAILGQMILGGIEIVQLRAKGIPSTVVREWIPPLNKIASEANVPLIINDFPELAELAQGVHVGQDDARLADVRSQCGPNAIIGKSTHSLQQAIAAQAEGADYIGFGPLFPTPTKAGRPSIGLRDIAAVHRSVSVPIFCIGGIKRENLPEVIAAGARRIVIVSGILQAVDIPGYINDCKALMA